MARANSRKAAGRSKPRARSGGEVPGSVKGKGRLKREATEAQIVDAFHRVVQRDGLRNVRVNAVIKEAGVGNLINQLIAYSKYDDGKPQPVVQVQEFHIDQRPFVRFEVTDEKAAGNGAPSRIRVYFDRQTNLPTRFEAYDLRNELIEYFEYKDIRFNVGMTDASFP